MPCNLHCTSLADAFQQMTYRSLTDTSTWFVIIQYPEPDSFTLYDSASLSSDAEIPPFTVEDIVFQGNRFRIVEFFASFATATIAIPRYQ